MLQSEKAHVAQQIANGITSICAGGAVIGIITGTEGDKMKVASGDYNSMIDKKIAEISSSATCNNLAPGRMHHNNIEKLNGITEHTEF